MNKKSVSHQSPSSPFPFPVHHFTPVHHSPPLRQLLLPVSFVPSRDSLCMAKCVGEHTYMCKRQRKKQTSQLCLIKIKHVSWDQSRPGHCPNSSVTKVGPTTAEVETERTALAGYRHQAYLVRALCTSCQGLNPSIPLF